MGMMKKILDDKALLVRYKKSTRHNPPLSTITTSNDDDRDWLDDSDSDIHEPNTYFGQPDDYELVEDVAN